MGLNRTDEYIININKRQDTWFVFTYLVLQQSFIGRLAGVELLICHNLEVFA